MRSRALVVVGLALALAGSAQADTPLLRVDREAGAARLNWTGGVTDYVAYESIDAARVVSPGRIATTTAASEWTRSDAPGDAALLFFKVGCPGGGCDETCFDGLDNDGDTLVDCADDECFGLPDCTPETDCTNGRDDEGDDLIDCADPDCITGCDDGVACTVDTCDVLAPGGCRNEPVDCDDMDACTVDACDPADGSCDHVPVACDDGDACNGLETCNPADGSCLPGTPVVCDDGDACNGLETCDPVDGSCLPGTPVACDDMDACNGLETCSPADGSCLPGTPVACDDGDGCNGLETCNPADGSCVPGVPVTCDDRDACNGLEACDPTDGSCLPGAPVDCQDGDPCNGLETCVPADGSCLPGTPVVCDDMDACNGVEACDPTDGSCLPGTPVACDDGDACNGLETCVPADGSCLPGTPVACSDGDACTDDVCAPADGSCTFPPRSCDDGDPCTIDRCVPGVGCAHDPDPSPTLARSAQLAGNQLAQYPFFENVRAFNQDEFIEVALDPTLNPAIGGATCDVYVVTARTAAQWCADRTLVDVRGGPDLRTFGAGSIQAATFALAAPNDLSGTPPGTSVGAPYDVVLDCDRDGQLDATDWLDGGRGEPGFSVLHDLTRLGPLAVTVYSSVGPLSDALDQSDWMPEGDDYRVVYPTALDDSTFVGTFPMIVISHGNGHAPDWYHDLQAHLASYGFIVFAHDNHTMPGIAQASSSTLFWTDRFIAEQATIVPGGVLSGHLDDSRIIWIGHSRGGEGVVRAYDRIRDEGFVPAQFGLADIRLVLSMAPTDFLGGGLSNAGSVPYGLLYGAQDNDVNGCANSDVATSFNLFERATGLRASHYVHGANHAWFHDCNGQEDAPFLETPPAPISCAEQNAVQFGWCLALVKHVLEGNLAAKDLLWRQYESIRPIGVAAATIVVNDFRDLVGAAFVLDDYETQGATSVASSGGAVTTTVTNLNEGICDDGDGSFAWLASDPMNGMTRANRVETPMDAPRCTVFDYTAAATHRIDVPAGQRNWSTAGYLSMRSCQGTRHPQTTAELADVTFTVTLVDGASVTSSINIGAYGGGIEEPYQRTGSFLTGCNTGGAGWANEFEVIRIRLTDFRANGSGIDLSNVVAVRLDFGAGSGSTQGRLGFDDIRLSAE